MKKRILSLMLCIAMLLSSALFLSSCSKIDDGLKISRKVVDVDLSGYSIVTGTELTEKGNQHALDFAKKMSELVALEMSAITETETADVETEAPEILIGKTHRLETAKVLNDIEGVGWAVCVVKNKIVIVGTTPYLTRVALNWFERAYLNAEHVSATTLSVNQKAMMSEMSTVLIAPTEGGLKDAFTVVYDAGKDGNDVPYQIATQVYNDLRDKMGIQAIFATSNSDVQKKELLIGNMNRSDAKAEMAKVEVNEYAVSVENGKIYLVAWSDEVLPSAYELFEDVLLGSSVTDAAGNTVYEIPSNSLLVQTYACDWVIDFPKPVGEGIYPEAAVDVGEGSYQYIYKGEGITREAFVAYCETLKAAGYTPMESEDVQWEGSSFRTFVNDEKGVSLHVSHMAFSNAEEQEVRGLPNSIRIVAGHTEWAGTVVDEQYFRPQVEGVDYVRRMNSQITSNLIDCTAPGNWGLGQIITLADGSFVVIDGGRVYGKGETENVWNVMCEMHKKAHGSYPTAENPLHIRAWLITHEHGDHHNLVQKFFTLYGKKEELKFDYLMYNPGSDTQLRVAGATTNLRNNMKYYQEQVENGFEYIQVNTGQVFYFANCRIEILTTVDDIYPWRCSEQNNASLIFRTALLESDGQNTHETTSLWLGDAELQISQAARAMWGSFLESDQVQVSHHGRWGGSEQRLYRLVGNCEVIWFPCLANKGSLDACLDGGWSFCPSFMNPECKLLIFDGSNYEGFPKWNVTLTITATGPLYDQLYDACTGDPIVAKGCDERGEPMLWPVIDVQAYKTASGR